MMNVKIIEKNGSISLLLKKLIKKENINKKDCILLPFKTLKKIVSIFLPFIFIPPSISLAVVNKF